MTASFSCSQCPAVFSRSAHLRRHQKTHRAEKPHVCTYCSVASSRKDVIARHTRNFHPDKLALAGDKAQQKNTTATPPTTEPDMVVPATPCLPQDTHEQQQQQQQQQQHDHENQQLQHYAQLPSLDHPSLDYPIDFDLFDFQTADFSATALDVLVAAPLDASSVAFNVNPPLPASPVRSLSTSSKDADYASALANFTVCNPHPTSPVFEFPSKIAASQYINAFFRHMAPHMPVVHEPTFDMGSTAAPLLIEIMACGALYLCQRTTAVAMHAAAQQLMFQIERGNESHGANSKFQLWTLQTYLLMSYFGAFVGNVSQQQRATHVFPHAIKLAQDALQELDTCQASTYRDWVYKESISRAIAHTIEIGAALASTAKEQCFTAPFFDASFPLSSDTKSWQQNEENWQVSSPQPDSCEVLDCILAGKMPESSVSELGLVTLVSSILWRVCAFEALSGSYPVELCTDLVEKTDRGVRMLDLIIKEQITNVRDENTILSPLLKSAKALLNSVFYHLYASQTLTEMKRVLDSPTKQKVPNTMSKKDRPAQLSLALIRAGEDMQADCQLGVNYIRRMAPHQFGPICATACCEGGLLLCWYLNAKPLYLSSPELTATMDQVIDEISSNLKGLNNTALIHHVNLPLQVSADLLSDHAVWQWPSGLSQKLQLLTKSSSGMNFHAGLTA